MFAVVITYKCPIEDVEKYHAEHVEFLTKQYDAGVFVASGRRNPRVGGVILASGVEKDELESILALDPFKRENLADYDVIEFIPSRMQPGFEAFIGE
ncbi:YciI family protein [Hydrogenovibrio kuenenii]|uniref:YciI family protein n=1 Tax=Hydrogenovibrio kuenenii TaxID=63658 RepID=UPI0004659D3A|nr:YciI family protein [Hydrogenovibrio kuenenii]